MAREFSKPFYDSTAWRKCRKAFISERIAIDGGLCQECGEAIGYIVDHVEELTPENINNPSITLDHNNFRYLCLACHNRKTFSKDNERPRYIFGDDGQIVPLPP